MQTPSYQQPNRRNPTAAVLSLTFGSALNPLNSSMIAVALVILREHFGLDVATVTWVITAFYLASMVGQPLMGRLADRFGARRLFTLGMALVVVSTALAPFSPTFFWLCVARVVMALGTATAFPSAVVLTQSLSESAGVPPAKLLARIQVSNTLGAALGPVIGGLLVHLLGWQALFLLNVPLAVIALLGVQRFVPPDRPNERGSVAALLKNSDFSGIALFTAAMIALVMAGINAVPEARWLLAVAGFALGVVFLWRESKARTPFVDVRVLVSNRPLLLIYVIFAVFNMVYYVAFFGLPQYLEVFGQFPVDAVGLLMFPLAAVSAVFSPTVAKLLERRGVRPLLLGGLVVLTVTSALLLVLSFTTAALLVVLLTAAMGVPYCVVSLASSQALYSSTSLEQRGVASGMLQTSRYVGSISATVVIGAVFSTGIDSSRWTMLSVIMVGISIVALLVALPWRAATKR